MPTPNNKAADDREAEASPSPSPSPISSTTASSPTKEDLINGCYEVIEGLKSLEDDDAFKRLQARVAKHPSLDNGQVQTILKKRDEDIAKAEAQIDDFRKKYEKEMQVSGDEKTAASIKC